MIALFLAAAVAGAPPAPSGAIITATPRSGSCAQGSMVDGLVCRALEAQRSGNAEAAARGFEQAAGAAPDSDPKKARLWAAAGNMWIAAGQPAKAALDLDKGLALPGLDGQQRGEALLDRARAAEAQDDLKTARAKLTEALPSVSADPFAWYFSAALAIREGDAATAKSAIAQALGLAPNDPAVLFEAGHVADFTGNDDQARSYWQRAASADPSGPVGKAAARAIEMLGVTPSVKADAPAQPRS